MWLVRQIYSSYFLKDVLYEVVTSIQMKLVAAYEYYWGVSFGLYSFKIGVSFEFLKSTWFLLSLYSKFNHLDKFVSLLNFWQLLWIIWIIIF